MEINNIGIIHFSEGVYTGEVTDNGRHYFGYGAWVNDVAYVSAK